MAFSCHMKHVPEACFPASSIHIDSGIKQHGVMAQRGVWIAFINAVVDQQRQFVLSGNMPSNFDGWVLMQTE